MACGLLAVISFQALAPLGQRHPFRLMGNYPLFKVLLELSSPSCFCSDEHSHCSEPVKFP